MRVAVKRDGHAAAANLVLEKRDERCVLLNRKCFTRVPVFLRNALALVADRERDGGQADRQSIPHIVIHALQRVRRREVARVIVSQRHPHAGAFICSRSAKTAR